MSQPRVSRQIALSGSAAWCATSGKSYTSLKDPFHSGQRSRQRQSVATGRRDRTLVRRADDEARPVLDHVLKKQVGVRFAVEQMDRLGVTRESSFDRVDRFGPAVRFAFLGCNAVGALVVAGRTPTHVSR